MSNYQPKPGSGSIFKNEKKSEKAPDYKGKGLDLDGKPVEIALWVKEYKDKKTGETKKYFSWKMEEPEEKPVDTPTVPEGKDDDIPF